MSAVSGRPPVFLLMLIFFCAYRSFQLLPVHNIPGVFSITDAGIILTGFGLVVYIFFKRARLDRINNPFTWFFLMYLLFILTQASLALINYGQSIVDGLLIARHQLYYCSFFLFLLVLDSRKKTQYFINWLTVLSVVLIAVALINYLGPTILHHKWAEGHGVRSGITRALVPGLGIILFTGLWHLVRYVEENKPSLWPLAYFLLTYGLVIFRQTRGRIIALTAAVVLLLFNHRRFKLLGGMVVLIAIVTAPLSLIMEKNIILDLFGQAYEDMAENTGTWRARKLQIEDDWEVFKEHPYFGNGGIVLRLGGETGVRKTGEVVFAAYGADLGYMHWLKFFGITGVVWMVLFIAMFYSRLVRIMKYPDTDKVMAKFSGYLFTYMVIAEVTLDFFTGPSGILMMCMTVAIMLNSSGAAEKNTALA